MPALNLDAAFVHMNLGDERGNAAYTGIDPYFDDLFLMSAQQRFLSVEKVVSTEELVKSVVPQQLLINRMMVDTVVEAPAARTSPQANRITSATRSSSGTTPRRPDPKRPGRVRQDLPVRQRGGLPSGRAQVPGGTAMTEPTRADVCAVACAELFGDAGEIMVSPMTTIVSVGARLARLTFSPEIVLTDGEAPADRRHPAIGAPAAIEGWMPFGRSSRPWPGAAAMW